MLSQLVLGSPFGLQSFCHSTILKMITLLVDILKVDSNRIGRFEKRAGITWGSFLPLVYMYEPKPNFSEFSENSKDISQLHHLSLDFILYTLESTLWRKDHVDVLIKEQLLDYVIMLPWFVPPQSKHRSIAVVHEVTKFCQIQPPSLLTICKGKLSKETLGLQKILHIKSVIMLTEMFNTF